MKCWDVGEEAFSVPGCMGVVVHVVGFVGNLSVPAGVQGACYGVLYSAQWCVELVYDWAKVCRGLSDLQYRYVSKEETPV